MLNILYILHTTHPTDGSTKAIMQWLEYPDDHIRPVVIVPDTNGIYERLKKMGIAVYAFPFRSSAYPTPLHSWKDWIMFVPRSIARVHLNTKAYYQTLRIIRQEQIDLVHTNTGIVRFGWHAALKSHIPHVWHIREYAEHIGYHLFPSNDTHRKELQHSYTVCITRHLQHHYRLSDNSHSYVIYDGVLSKAQVFPVVPKEPYFLYAGRIEAAKGIDDLLQAFSVYAQRTSLPIPLWLAGSCEADYAQHIQNEAERLHITQYIEMKGFCNNILPLMQKASAVIVPSLTEGFGFVMAETQFTGSLVVVRDIQGLHEQLELGYSTTGNPTALAFANLQELAQHLTDITQKGIHTYDAIIRNGQRFAQTTFSLENNREQITRIYQSVIHQTL